MEPTLNPGSGFLRFRIDFSYDGSNFAGWAKQPNQRTVQGTLTQILSGLTRNPIELVVAGRTDAGVHATGQVAHFDLPVRDKYRKDWQCEEIKYRLNRMISEDIRINRVSHAPNFFHARFSALSRTYIYKIVDGNRIIQPIQRLDVAPWYRELDVERMNDASAKLLGEHDFAAFCKSGGVGTTIRRLDKFTWRRDEHQILIAEVRADAFCYSMVRNLVGAAACVGEGRFNPDWMTEVLANKARVSESLVFPARGLTLVNVEYPPDSQLQSRAEITIRRRDED